MIDLQRKAARDARGRDRLQTYAGAPVSTSGGVETESSRSRLQAMLSVLPAEHRQVLVMSYVEGKSHSEIAGETGLPLGTVKAQIRSCKAAHCLANKDDPEKAMPKIIMTITM